MRPAVRQILLGRGGRGAVTLSDNFERSDTTAPSLGVPTSVRRTTPNPWQLFTNNMALPAVGGHISGNKYVADDGQIVYAVQHLYRPIRSVRALVNFANSGQGALTSYGSQTLIISKDSGVIQNAVHLVLTRVGLTVQKIVNTSFTSLTGGWSWGSTTYAPKDGTTLIPFQFDFDESGNWTALYAGRLASGTDAALPALAGLSDSYVCAEVFNSPITNLDSRAEYDGVAFGPTGGLFDVLPVIYQNNFDSSTGLNLGTGWSIGSGVATNSGSAGNLTPTAGPPAAIGKRYLTTYTITPSGFINGSLTFSFGGASGATRTAQGTYSDILTAVDTSSWVIASGAGTTSKFVNEFSIVQLDTF